jgi:hypothetical protein
MTGEKARHGGEIGELPGRVFVLGASAVARAEVPVIEGEGDEPFPCDGLAIVAGHLFLDPGEGAGEHDRRSRNAAGREAEVTGEQEPVDTDAFLVE